PRAACLPRPSPLGSGRCRSRSSPELPPRSPGKWTDCSPARPSKRLPTAERSTPSCMISQSGAAMTRRRRATASSCASSNPPSAPRRAQGTERTLLADDDPATRTCSRYISSARAWKRLGDIRACFRGRGGQHVAVYTAARSRIDRRSGGHGHHHVGSSLEQAARRRRTGADRYSPVSIASVGVGLCLSPLAQESTARVEFNRYTNVLIHLQDPVSVAIDESGHIYVAESSAHQVSVLSRDGTEIIRIGKRGSGPGELCGPRGVAVSHDG